MATPGARVEFRAAALHGRPFRYDSSSRAAHVQHAAPIAIGGAARPGADVQSLFTVAMLLGSRPGPVGHPVAAHFDSD
jgi:hypothetical protein